MTNDAPFYHYSAEHARQVGQLEMWRASHQANIACKEAIENAIRRDFDGMYLKPECAATVIEEFGYYRTAYVLANTLREKNHDGRFSPDNRKWAGGTFIVDEPRNRSHFVVDSHPAVLDGFIQMFRDEYQKLQLYGGGHCQENGSSMDYEGKVLVLKPETLNEKYWESKYQLWYAHDGFGCRPSARGRSIRATCLADGEMCRWNRQDFIGPIQEELLPDWAREQVEKIQTQEHIPGYPETDSPEINM